MVGPYTNEKNYAAKSGDGSRAHGLAWLYEMVVLAVPNVAALPEYDSRIRAMSEKVGASKVAGGRTPLVSVVSLQVDPFSEEDHAALAGLANRP